MITRLFSATLKGIDALEVEVEVNARGSEQPRIIIVGLPDAAVRESAERVTSAITATGLAFDQGTNTVNLAPADLKKEGPSFDLPIAIAMISTGMLCPLPNTTEALLVGELSLDGTLRPVKGILSIAIEAKRCGRKELLLPAINAPEAAIISGLNIIPIHSLKEAWDHVSGTALIPPYILDRSEVFAKTSTQDTPDFSEVKGQNYVKRALEVAISGGHNVLMVGPPGTGKSMLAKRLPGIMPPLSEEEAIETTRVHSIAGILPLKQSLITSRPFRAPHHTISDAGLLGGGTNPGPGEVSLAHNGILFLDELPEFKRQTLEVLRQPLEDGQVTITRAAGSLTFPSRCIIIAALNPCPCGFLGDSKRPCRCSTRQIEQYRQKISGPLLDRIDLHIEVPLIEYKELSSHTPEESTARIRARVLKTREIQNQRFKESSLSSKTNAAMSTKQMQMHCQLDSSSSALLEQAMEQLHFSARAYHRILKVARTLADMDQHKQLTDTHLLEALQYRSLDRQLF